MNTEETDKPAGENPPAPQGRADPPMVRSEDLFSAGRELVILHEGQEYRLRLTRQNKLILTK